MGRDTAGVRGMKMRSGDEVVSCDVCGENDILLITSSGYGKRTKIERFNVQGRGGQGVIAIRITGKKGQLASAMVVDIDDEVFLISSGGTTIRTPVREISSQGRDATGVRVMNLDNGQTVAAVAKVLVGGDDA